MKNLVQITAAAFMLAAPIGAQAQESADFSISPAEAAATVERDMTAAARVLVRLGEHDYRPVAFMPTSDSEQESLLVMVSGNGTQAYIRLPSLTMDLLEGGPAEPIVDQLAVGLGNGDVFAGDAQISVDSEGYLRVTGTLQEIDTKKPMSVDLVLHEAAAGMGNSTLEVAGDTMVLNGTLGTMTYVQMRDTIAEHPEVKTLILDQVDGSVNDEINVHTGRLVRKAGLTTRVTKTSRVYSGGVDLFSSGVSRIVELGAEVGVHSWCCVEGTTAAELPKDDPAHSHQLSYFTEMLGPDLGPEFYFFTLNAAPAEGMKNMTPDEMRRFSLATKILE